MAEKRRMAENSNTAGRKTVTAGRMAVAAVVFMVITAMLLAACRKTGAATEMAAAQTPGTLENGVYLSGDGRFTVKADEAKWQSTGSGELWELSLLEDRSVHISFSPAEGLNKEMIADFETSFADGYVEALKEEYPDIKKTDIREVSEELAGLGMTMTGPGGGDRMYQLLYLASDGENGYLITAAFPAEQETVLKQEVMQVIESISFIDKEQT
ncbi:hypothetical protein [Clostridium transplantifaecale]|uniref:hypothetical protein n=1 Tax=Clostridium transplantifaecale TaxID=2479838 RepID=UPI001FAAD7F7|nr:hypothetical protein [Clostridium transplantifaecale]